MLVLQRSNNYKLDVCEALKRRAFLKQEQLQLLEDIQWKIARGLEGEQRSDKFWDDLHVSIPYRLFHDVEVYRKKTFHHQMDTVFVCDRFVLIVELKHISGEIYYDASANQLWRQQNGQRLALGDPFSQVLRHEDWMQHFLWEIGVDLPIISAIVVTANRALIAKMPTYYHMFKLEGLRIKLQQWIQQYEPVANENMLQLIEQHLLQQLVRKKWQHPFGDVQLRTGALCDCGLRMQYENGVFSCVCGQRNRDRFRIGLHDYRLLVDEWITNQEFRAFFNIESMQAVNKILKRLNLQTEGATKSRKYLIPENIWRK